MVAVFLSALDLTVIGRALPTIANALHDTKGDYIWVGSAYALSSTDFIPLSGNLVDVFGRKPVILVSISFFAVGSALAGASQNMSMMIGARAVQGIGGGGILTLMEIITADLVPLSERGMYQGLLGMVWCLASFTGPPIGGALLSQGSKAWCWLFYLNLPLSTLAFFLVVIYLSVNRPEGSVRDKLTKVDWVGNGIVILGTGLAIIGMTWGGIRYPWASVEVLAPLIFGLSLLVIFAFYEAKVPIRPTIPLDVVSNRTSLSYLLPPLMESLAYVAMIYYLPVFFQACFGVTIAVLKKYRAVNWIGWSATIIGYGLISTLREDSSVGKWVGYQVIGAIGVGLIFSAPLFPLLAPLPNTRAASALALFTFTPSFSQMWGITISSTILQNTLEKKLPATFVAQFPPGFEIAYTAIPVIPQLEAPLRKQVQAVFTDSMAVIWQTMIGIAGLGLLLSFFMVRHVTSAGHPRVIAG
ncbi:iron permease [Mycena sp. CBHHK59/15]|nr:iron permease [Mycena sp. CBHHK59/15]